MKREAKVVNVDGRLMAEVVRTEACQQCHACQFGQKERMLVELPEGNYAVGDTVELSLPDARFARASLLAYALPVATLFAGLLIAAFAGPRSGRRCARLSGWEQASPSSNCWSRVCAKCARTCGPAIKRRNKLCLNRS